MKRLLFLTLSLFLFASNLPALTYETLTSGMEAEDLDKTGLGKLSEEEQKQLDLWFKYQSENYFFSLPKIEKGQDQKVFFKTERRLPLNTPPQNKWNLALAATFQNETPYLREFIDFHLRMGVEHFLLYDNLSSDHFYPEIQDYIEQGIVELFEWPVSNFVKGQGICYTDAVHRCKGKAKWLILADTDLFFFPLSEDNLPSLLKSFDRPHIGGLTVTMLYFGTSGVETLQKGERLTQLLTKCANYYNPLVRLIVRPDKVINVINPHAVEYHPQYFAVDENYIENSGVVNSMVPANKIRANHYNFRTLDFLRNEYGIRHARFQAEKKNLPLPNEIPPDEWEKLLKLDASLSLSEDYQIQRFIF